MAPRPSACSPLSARSQFEQAIQSAFREVADAPAERLFSSGLASAFERQDAERLKLIVRQAVVQSQLAERLNALQSVPHTWGRGRRTALIRPAGYGSVWRGRR